MNWRPKVKSKMLEFFDLLIICLIAFVTACITGVIGVAGGLLPAIFSDTICWHCIDPSSFVCHAVVWQHFKGLGQSS